MIALSISSVAQWGCPFCGYRFLSIVETHRDTAATMRCRNPDCQGICVLLTEGERSVNVGEVALELQSHPREGTPLWGA